MAVTAGLGEGAATALSLHQEHAFIGATSEQHIAQHRLERILVDLWLEGLVYIAVLIQDGERFDFWQLDWFSRHVLV